MMALPIFQLGSNIWTGAWVSEYRYLSAVSLNLEPCLSLEHVQWNCHHHALLLRTVVDEEGSGAAADVPGGHGGQHFV